MPPTPSLRCSDAVRHAPPAHGGSRFTHRSPRSLSAGGCFFHMGSAVPIVKVFTVRADRRLVVVFVSAVMLTPPPHQATELDSETSMQGTPGRHSFPFQNQGLQFVVGGRNVGVAAQQTRIYGDPGSKVRFLAIPSVGDSSTDLTLSGYLARVS